MKTHRWLWVLLIAVACGRSAAQSTRPNILFIYADDQSYKTLSCYPEAPDWVRTPNIDKLATRGVRFTRAYFGAWCMPSRASLLTGRLQHAIESEFGRQSNWGQPDYPILKTTMPGNKAVSVA